MVVLPLAVAKLAKVTLPLMTSLTPDPTLRSAPSTWMTRADEKVFSSNIARPLKISTFGMPALVIWIDP